ncbi:hypothetical protein EXIGLDRAFT_777766 [Exidia glandulosa HHB12029]|uniref:Uncharacterized protein n=1 Tax=Exidia glandulosa HHB12029 TaxID=1314781 RepID=A0A165CVQ4_EXIGL|nr:hypothetical protein EXIGLDRAFT_777766 [Exidia glandulosa HHB12029]
MPPKIAIPAAASTADLIARHRAVVPRIRALLGFIAAADGDAEALSSLRAQLRALREENALLVGELQARIALGDLDSFVPEVADAPPPAMTAPPPARRSKTKKPASAAAKGPSGDRLEVVVPTLEEVRREAKKRKAPRTPTPPPAAPTSKKARKAPKKEKKNAKKAAASEEAEAIEADDEEDNLLFEQPCDFCRSTQQPCRVWTGHRASRSCAACHGRHMSCTRNGVRVAATPVAGASTADIAAVVAEALRQVGIVPVAQPSREPDDSSPRRLRRRLPSSSSEDEEDRAPKKRVRVKSPTKTPGVSTPPPRVKEEPADDIRIPAPMRGVVINLADSDEDAPPPPTTDVEDSAMATDVAQDDEEDSEDDAKAAEEQDEKAAEPAGESDGATSSESAKSTESEGSSEEESEEESGSESDAKSDRSKTVVA